MWESAWTIIRTVEVRLDDRDFVWKQVVIRLIGSKTSIEQVGPWFVHCKRNQGPPSEWCTWGDVCVVVSILDRGRLVSTLNSVRLFRSTGVPLRKWTTSIRHFYFFHKRGSLHACGCVQIYVKLLRPFALWYLPLIISRISVVFLYL